MGKTHLWQCESFIFLKYNLTESSLSLPVEAGLKSQSPVYLARARDAIQPDSRISDKVTHFIPDPHLHCDIQVARSHLSGETDDGLDGMMIPGDEVTQHSIYDQSSGRSRKVNPVENERARRSKNEPPLRSCLNAPARFPYRVFQMPQKPQFEPESSIT